MANYLLIESRDPFEARDVSYFYGLAADLAAQGDKAVVTAAIDNLVKGASGQGVECFNIAFGFDRSAGLEGNLQWP